MTEDKIALREEIIVQKEEMSLKKSPNLKRHIKGERAGKEEILDHDSDRPFV